MHPGSKIAVAIMLALGASHLSDHCGGDNVFCLLMLPLTVFCAPGAFLSSGVRSLEEILLYALGVVLNAYLLGYLAWWLALEPAGKAWEWFWRPSDEA